MDHIGSRPVRDSPSDSDRSMSHELDKVVGSLEKITLPLMELEPMIHQPSDHSGSAARIMLIVGGRRAVN